MSTNCQLVTFPLSLGRVYLAIVKGINAGKKLAITVNQLSNLVQDGTAIDGRKLRPFTFKGTTSCIYSFVNVLFRGALDSDDFFIGSLSWSVIIEKQR